MCVNRFHPEEIVSPDQSLEECGVTSGDCIVRAAEAAVGSGAWRESVGRSGGGLGALERFATVFVGIALLQCCLGV